VKEEASSKKHNLKVEVKWICLSWSEPFFNTYPQGVEQKAPKPKI